MVQDIMFTIWSSKSDSYSLWEVQGWNMLPTQIQWFFDCTLKSLFRFLSKQNMSEIYFYSCGGLLESILKELAPEAFPGNFPVGSGQYQHRKTGALASWFRVLQFGILIRTNWCPNEWEINAQRWVLEVHLGIFNCGGTCPTSTMWRLVRHHIYGNNPNMVN